MVDFGIKITGFLKNSLRKMYYLVHNTLLSKAVWAILLVIFLYGASDYHPKIFLINSLIAVPILASLILLTNRILVAIILTLAFGSIYHLLSLFKINLLNDTINFEDLRLITNIHKFAAGELIASYIDKIYVVYFTVVFILATYVIYHSDNMVSKKNLKRFFAIRIVMFVSGILILVVFYSVVATPKIFWSSFARVKTSQIEFCDIVYCKDNKQRTYCYYMGPFAELAYSINSKELEGKPVYESDDLIKKHLENYDNYSHEKKPLKILPNIVFVLNESTFNPKYLDYKFASGLNYDFFYDEKFTKAHGILRVHTLGGGSSTSEYPSVTGIVHKIFTSPSNYPFTSMTKLTKVSLFRELKKNGYYTILVYPVDKKFFRANEAYYELGVDKVVDIKDHNFKPDQWRDVPDRIIAKIIQSEIKKAPKNMPVFVYAATMINHGPHDSKHADILGCLSELKSDICSKVNDYINRLDRTDKDFMEFTNILMSSSKPTLFLNFGDHLPSFEGAISNMKFNYGDGNNVDYFRTFFNIRANFELNDDYNYDYLDIGYLPGIIIDILGFKEKSLFYKANSYMRRKCNGEFYLCKTINNELFESYKALMIEQLDFIPEVISRDE